MTANENKYKLRVPDEVASNLRRLHPEIKSYIRSGLKNILDNPGIGKALKEELQGLRSYRVKRYRIVYRINQEQHDIEIIAIGPRRNIYAETYRLLTKENKI